MTGLSRLQMLQAAQRGPQRKMLANETDTSTVQVSEFQMTVISKDVIKYAEALRYFQNIAIQDEQVLLPAKDAVARIPITNAHLTVTESQTAEGAERTYTELTNTDTVSITPAAKLGAILISKQLVDTSSLNFIDLARYTMMQHHENAVDVAVRQAIETGATTNLVFGGTASACSGLATGNTFTLDLLADAVEKIHAFDFKGQKYFFISSKQEKIFIKSSQFTNAAEYGSDVVRKNGEIGTDNYIGAKIIVTSNTKGYAATNTDGTDGTAWGAAGHSCALISEHMGMPVAAAIAWKQKLTIDYEYLKKYAAHYIYYDSNYAAATAQPKAVCLVKVTDA